jgi:hypothetical protein
MQHTAVAQIMRCNNCEIEFDKYGNIMGEESEPDESMDGDFDSAMASAGFGTDEDYGYYGDDC